MDLGNLPDVRERRYYCCSQELYELENLFVLKKNIFAMKRCIFQNESFSPWLFVIIWYLFVFKMVPISMVVGKVSMGYQLRKDGPVVNYLLFIDDLKLFAES